MVTEMEKIECRNAVNKLLNVIDRNGFDGLKKIIEIYSKDYAPRIDIFNLTKLLKGDMYYAQNFINGRLR